MHLYVQLSLCQSEYTVYKGYPSLILSLNFFSYLCSLLLKVPLNSGAEQWMSELLLSTHSTLRHLILHAVDIKDPTSFSLEDCAHGSLTQVANMALYFQWMRECEQALVQCRYDRRALPGTRNKFNVWAVSRFSNLLMRNAWKVSDEPLTRVHRIKLESLAMVSDAFLSTV